MTKSPKVFLARASQHFANRSFTKTLPTDGLGELQRQGDASAEHRGGFEEGGKGEQAQVGGGGWGLFFLTCNSLNFLFEWEIDFLTLDFILLVD